MSDLTFITERRFKRVLTPAEFKAELGVETDCAMASKMGVGRAGLCRRLSLHREKDHYRILDLGNGKFAPAHVGPTFEI